MYSLELFTKFFSNKSEPNFKILNDMIDKKNYFDSFPELEQIIEKESEMSEEDKSKYFPKIYFILGEYHFTMGEFYNGFDFFDSSIKYFNIYKEKIDSTNKNDITIIDFYIGSNYYYLFEITDNIFFLENSKLYFENIKKNLSLLNTSNVDALYFKLGLIYKHLASFKSNDYENYLNISLEYFNTIYVKYSKSKKDQFVYFYIGNHIGSIYSKLMHINSTYENLAIQYFTGAINFYNNKLNSVTFEKDPSLNSLLNLSLGQTYQELSFIIADEQYIKLAEGCYLNSSRFFSKNTYPGLNSTIVKYLSNLYNKDKRT